MDQNDIDHFAYALSTLLSIQCTYMIRFQYFFCQTNGLYVGTQCHSKVSPGVDQNDIDHFGYTYSTVLTRSLPWAGGSGLWYIYHWLPWAAHSGFFDLKVNKHLDTLTCHWFGSMLILMMSDFALSHYQRLMGLRVLQEIFHACFAPVYPEFPEYYLVQSCSICLVKYGNERVKSPGYLYDQVSKLFLASLMVGCRYPFQSVTRNGPKLRMFCFCMLNIVGGGFIWTWMLIEMSTVRAYLWCTIHS